MAEIPINYLKYIDQDGTEKKVYPITVTDAVYDSDGNKLSNVLLGVLKDTDISNVQSDSTTTVPSSALLKATDDKIGDTSSLPGESSNVVSAINQLNSGMQNRGTVLAANGTVANSPNNYFDVCSLELPDAPYLVLGRLNALFNGIASDLMFAQLGDTIVRTTLQSGGGCVVWAYSDGGETLSLRSYGYTTNSGNFSGALLAIRLK